MWGYNREVKKMLKQDVHYRKPHLLKIGEVKDKIFHYANFEMLNDGTIPFEYTASEKEDKETKNKAYQVFTKFSRQKLGTFFIRKFDNKLFLVELGSKQVFYGKTDFLRLEEVKEARFILQENSETRVALFLQIGELSDPKRIIRETVRTRQILCSKTFPPEAMLGAVMQNWRKFI